MGKKRDGGGGRWVRARVLCEGIGDGNQLTITHDWCKNGVGISNRAALFWEMPRPQATWSQGFERREESERGGKA